MPLQEGRELIDLSLADPLYYIQTELGRSIHNTTGSWALVADKNCTDWALVYVLIPPEGGLMAAWTDHLMKSVAPRHRASNRGQVHSRVLPHFPCLSIDAQFSTACQHVDQPKFRAGPHANHSTLSECSLVHLLSVRLGGTFGTRIPRRAKHILMI
jgi:hypothetical protein